LTFSGKRDLAVAKEEFIAKNTADLPWVDAGDIPGLPPGREVKILRRYDEDDYSLDMLVRIPPGEVEPRHAHDAEHMLMVVEGRVVIDGKTLGPGDYIYSPRNVPHGPVEYPDGCLLYTSHRGKLARYNDDANEAGAAVRPHSTSGGATATTGPTALTVCDIAWMDAKQLIELPPGLEVKVLRHDVADDNARDLLVHFPPGYTEPRHMHWGSHNNVILEGRMLIDGKTLNHGDYVYGPGGVWHGPFHYPDGITLCAFHRGDPRHFYEGKEHVYGQTIENYGEPGGS
jgi:quercetin dioxygenase-like cupin family protein